MGGERPRWPRLGQRDRGGLFIGRLSIGFKHDSIAALGRQEVRHLGKIFPRKQMGRRFGRTGEFAHRSF